MSLPGLHGGKRCSRDEHQMQGKTVSKEIDRMIAVFSGCCDYSLFSNFLDPSGDLQRKMQVGWGC